MCLNCILARRPIDRRTVSKYNELEIILFVSIIIITYPYCNGNASDKKVIGDCVQFGND